jgi:formylglycine-generating enzyme required for sulfatase activity
MPQSSSPSPAYLAKLRRNLTGLAETDLRNFCFDHGIDYDALPTTTVSVLDKARAIVDYLNKRGRLGELTAWGQAEFPNLMWEIEGAELPKPVTDSASDARTAKSVTATPLRRLWPTLGLVVAFFVVAGTVALAIRSVSSSLEPVVPTPSATQTNAPTPTATQPPTPISLPTDTPQAAMVGNVAASAVTSTLAPTLTLQLAPGVDMEFVLVPAGEFLMGSDPARDSNAQDDEKPQHRVYLSEYYIGKYEVTNAQYAVFAKDQRRNFQMPSGKENHPVVNVSWVSAIAFTEWLSDKFRMTVRLPTEAQWERACRGTDDRIYPWRGQFYGDKLNIKDSGLDTTTSVGKYPHSSPGDSPYGAAEMSGNVWEWILDHYDESLYTKLPQSSSPIVDPTGPASGTYRVMRGGSFKDNEASARCANRNGLGQDQSNDDLGFRLVIR